MTTNPDSPTLITVPPREGDGAGRAPAGDIVLRVSDLSVYYGAFRAVRNVDMYIKRGRITPPDQADPQPLPGPNVFDYKSDLPGGSEVDTVVIECGEDGVCQCRSSVMTPTMLDCSAPTGMR